MFYQTLQSEPFLGAAGWTAVGSLSPGAAILRSTDQCSQSCILEFPYAAAKPLKQLNTCMGFIIIISTVQTDFTAVLFCLYPWGKQKQPCNSRAGFVTSCIGISCCTDCGWIFTLTVNGAMQNNAKQYKPSNTASQLHG